MKFSLASLLVLSVLAVPAAACDLECSLDRNLREQGITGVVYSIVDGDETRTGAVGLANHATGAPLRADSKVHIGSVAKTLLALGVLRLASQGRVNLDAPLSELLPSPTLDNPWHSRSPVRLRHLLDHTSGLDDMRLWQVFTLRATPRAPLAEAFSRPADLLRVRVEPGTRFSYSNMGYTLAGMVIEAVTGERYESWLDRELLKPLDMNDSTCEFVSQEGAAADPRLAWGHHDDLSTVSSLPIWPRPATQFTTTGADMARLARFLMSDGSIAGQPFIEESLLRQMGRATTTTAARAGLEAGYALGLARRDRHGAVGLCHLGNVVGFNAVLCVYPRHQKAFFMAFNTDSETARYGRFDELMVRSLGLGAAAAQPVAQSEPRDWQGRYVLAPSRFETFRLLDLLFGSVVARSSATGIELRGQGRPSQSLVPMGGILYRAADRIEASHVLLDEDGERFIADGSRTLQRIGAFYFFAHWLSFALGVLGLVTLLLLIPWRRLRRREPLAQPASLAWLLLLLPLPLLASQPFTGVGDMTAGSISLYVATLALPALMVWQLLWAVRRRAQVRSWPVHAVAAGLVLQLCVLLLCWGLLPFALWR